MPGHLECLKLLRGAGAELNQTTAVNGYSALHSATEGNQVEVVQWLVKEGIDINIKLTNGKYAGMTAQQMAQALSHSEIETILT